MAAGGHPSHLLAGVALILALTAAVYGPMIRYPYVYEDLNGPPLQWRGLRTELADRSGFRFAHPGRALSHLSSRLTHAISLQPWADHAVNLLTHLINVALVALVAWPVLGDGALLAALLFALHPVQVEAVVYASSRPDLLVGTGILIALLGVTYRRTPLLLIGLIVAALSKETGVMAAALALLWSRQIDRPLRGVGVWLLILLGGVLLIGHAVEFPLLAGARDIATHLVMFSRLLGLIVWPFGFTVDHNWQWIGDGALVLAMLAWLPIIALYPFRRSWLLFACLFALLAILPRLLLHDPEALHEHHLYGPMIGLSLSLGGWVSA